MGEQVRWFARWHCFPPICFRHRIPVRPACSRLSPCFPREALIVTTSFGRFRLIFVLFNTTELEAGGCCVVPGRRRVYSWTLAHAVCTYERDCGEGPAKWGRGKS